MQDKSIQRLRYRLNSIGCTDIHIKLCSGSETVFASFYYRDRLIRYHIPIRYIDDYPFVQYLFYL